MRAGLLFLFIMIIHTAVSAQEHPRDGSVLHHRLIGFKFPSHPKATSYRIQVFEYIRIGKSTDTVVLQVVSQEDKTNRIIATVPSFGRKYSWQVKYVRKNKVIGSAGPYHFSVAENPFADTTHMIVVNKATKYKDLLVFSDNSRTLYNMAGEPLWYLPFIPGVSDTTAGVIRDLEVTRDGTITFLTIKNIHEIDYDGNVLWSGPKDKGVNGNPIEQYHHEVTKLSNGNYLTIANVSISATSNDTSKKSKAKRSCGTIIEYNSKNEIVWTWNSCDHTRQEDPMAHFNACYFDEKRNAVYSSYRNLSRVVKAEYPSGRVLAQYGQDLEKTGAIKGDGMFYYQHNPNINSDGNLVLFNNNFDPLAPEAERNNSVPTVAVFKEPAGPNEPLQKIWEFRTDFDTLVKPMSSAGGSVRELDKGDYLVSTGLPGRYFIVSADKKVLWNVLVQHKEKGEWKPFPVYRISAVRKDEIAKMLFK